VKEKCIFSRNSQFYQTLLPVLILGFISISSSWVCAQSPDESASPDPSVPAASAVATRIEHARALAAAHHLRAAADELESVRASAKDDVVRSVTSVMLMSIHLEEGNYARAESLLEETFRARLAAQDGSIRTYFALAGQAVNGTRSHLARYRSFGINVADARLPAEAASDLDRLRSLLERMIAQAREITKADSKAYYSLALLEDVLGIRLSLARDNEDREKWQGEYAVARQRLATSETQIASLGGILKPTPKVDIAANPSDPLMQSGSASTESAESSAPKAVSRTLTTGSLNQRATKKVLPSYPSLAKASATEGIVRVYVTVGESGKVIDVLHSDGPILLKRAAEEAASQWKFSPTVVNDKPIRLTGYIEFTFTL
jgi:TonB family protein